MEIRQNWHKFQRLLGPLPPKKSGMVVLHSHNRILAGCLGLSSGVPRSGFSDIGRHVESLDSAWEEFSHKYSCVGASFLDNESLTEALGQVAAVKSSSPATDHFYAQLVRLREMMGIERGDKTNLALHFGERPVEHFWPRNNFLLALFRSFWGELFPEKKIVLLAIVHGSQSIDFLILEFVGAELKGFCEPDFSSIDWQGADLFLPETAARFVSLCESKYGLPAYSLFLTKRVWDECREIQMVQGERATWRHLRRVHAARDVEKEVLLEPNPWPMRALMYWNSL